MLPIILTDFRSGISIYFIPANIVSFYSDAIEGKERTKIVVQDSWYHVKETAAEINQSLVSLALAN